MYKCALQLISHTEIGGFLTCTFACKRNAHIYTSTPKREIHSLLKDIVAPFLIINYIKSNK